MGEIVSWRLLISINMDLTNKSYYMCPANRDFLAVHYHKMNYVWGFAIFQSAWEGDLFRSRFEVHYDYNRQWLQMSIYIINTIIYLQYWSLVCSRPPYVVQQFHLLPGGLRGGKRSGPWPFNAFAGTRPTLAPIGGKLLKEKINQTLILFDIQKTTKKSNKNFAHPGQKMPIFVSLYFSSIWRPLRTFSWPLLSLLRRF